MPDENNQAAESSAPAPAMVEAPNPDSPEYAEWRYSGKFPEAPKKPEAPATPKSVKTAPDSETGYQQQERRHSKAEARLNTILEDLRRAGLTPSELKTFKREARQAAEAAKPAQEQPVKPVAEEGPKRPRYEDFKTLDEYYAAEDKYLEAKLEQKLQQERIRQQREALRRRGAEELDTAAKRYGEDSRQVIVETATKLLGDDDTPPVNRVLAQLLNESPVLADLMFVIGSKPDDMAEFLKEAKTAPGKAVRRAVLLEKLVQEELAKSAKPARVSEPDEDVEEEEPPPAKKVTKAPAPPREASGAAAAPPDELASAVAGNDARRYFKEANRRDLQRRRAG